MTPTRIYDMMDAEALILGLGMFATGGGGLASRGRELFEELLADEIDVSWTFLDQLDDDALTCSVYGMGSIAPHPPMTADERRRFGVDDERYPRPWLRAVDELERHLSRRVEAIIPFELGPSNTLVALDAAARSGRVLVDGDYIGRALPEMSQALPSVLGAAVWPLTICDPWGNALVMIDCPSPKAAERVGKMVSKVTKAVDMGASCSHAAFPLTVAEARDAAIPGTLSECLRVGRSVLAARANAQDPIAAAVAAVDGELLFTGTVTARSWEDSAEGYMEGTTTLTSEEDGERVEIWYRNEHHLVTVEGKPLAMSPDIVAVVDAQSAEPISNTELAEGQQVTVIGIPARTPFRSGAALAVTEPRYYGFDFDYIPLEELTRAEA